MAVASLCVIMIPWINLFVNAFFLRSFPFTTWVFRFFNSFVSFFVLLFYFLFIVHSDFALSIIVSLKVKRWSTTNWANIFNTFGHQIFMVCYIVEVFIISFNNCGNRFVLICSHTKVTTSLSINTIPHKKTNYKCTNCTNFGIHDVLFLYILPIDKTAEMCYNRKYLALRPSTRRQKRGISASCLHFLHYLIVHHQTLSSITRNSFVIAYAIPLLISAKSYFFNFNDFIVLSFS